MCANFTVQRHKHKVYLVLLFHWKAIISITNWKKNCVLDLGWLRCNSASSLKIKIANILVPRSPTLIRKDERVANNREG